LLAFDAAILTSSFGQIYRKVRNLHHSVLMVKDCKSVFLGEFLQPMFIQWILDLVVSRVNFAVFKAMCFNKGVCRWPFSLLSLQCDL
jgi:hypothetical protein